MRFPAEVDGVWEIELEIDLIVGVRKDNLILIVRQIILTLF